MQAFQLEKVNRTDDEEIKAETPVSLKSTVSDPWELVANADK